MIAIIDLGIGNFANVQKAVGGIITSDPETIVKADKAILPGVGSFGFASKKLAEIKEAVCEIVHSGKPLLGICLGMQLFFSTSEEGRGKGLDIFKGKVLKFKGVKSPHIGWNRVKLLKNNELFKGIKDNAFFYFVHFYYVFPGDKRIIVAQTDFAKTVFPASVSKENVFGVQFHPEKSSENGLKLLENFRRL